MMACTSPLFTARSRPFRISLPSTVTCRFLTSSIGTSFVPSDLQAEMRDDLANQLLFPGFLVVGVDRTERASADVDLALLADHDHQAFRVHAFFRPGQQDALAIERRLHAAVLQALRRRQIGIEEFLQKRPGCLLTGA